MTERPSPSTEGIIRKTANLFVYAGETAMSALPTSAEFEVLQALAQKYPFLFHGADARDQATVGDVIARYLKDAKEDLSPAAYSARELYLNRFAEAFGSHRVADVTPIAVKEWIRSQEQFRSPWTRAAVNAALQRAFNWGARGKIIRENSIRGVELNEVKRPGRDMHADEFQAILRRSDLPFRRFLLALKFTGARPGELAKLQWSQIDWEAGIATLPEHKTAKKTGKPRVLFFVPPMLKMLRIIQRQQGENSAIAALRRILETSPNRQAKKQDIARAMRRLGYSDRALGRARDSLGVTFRRLGGWGRYGHTVYVLPEQVSVPKPEPSEHVFLCAKGRPWTKNALGQKLKRLREDLGLPNDCKLYGLRHFFITWAVKNNVPLKAIATLVGQTTTAMIERVYCHLDGDLGYLHDAAQQATATPTGDQATRLDES
jgi:integrase